MFELNQLRDVYLIVELITYRIQSSILASIGQNEI